MYRKELVVAVVVVFALGGLAHAEISGIQAFNVPMAYTADNETLVFDADPITQVRVDFSDLTFTTFSNVGTLYIETYLLEDLSGGGLAYGNFTGGILSVMWDYASEHYELGGDVTYFRLREMSPNVFSGSGQFEVGTVDFPTGYEWLADVGSIASFSFAFDQDFDNFTQDLTAISNLILTPDDSGIPEPATLALLLSGLLLLKPAIRRINIF